MKINEVNNVTALKRDKKMFRIICGISNQER
jgi:hypothetical protein